MCVEKEGKIFAADDDNDNNLNNDFAFAAKSCVFVLGEIRWGSAQPRVESGIVLEFFLDLGRVPEPKAEVFVCVFACLRAYSFSF